MLANGIYLIWVTAFFRALTIHAHYLREICSTAGYIINWRRTIESCHTLFHIQLCS